MELLERYIQEVESYLPKDLQDDVADELRSNLEEALEARSASGDPALQREIEIELLTGLGPPHRLADSYVPKPRVLFGPRLYPPFLRTMKIAVAVLVALSALGVIVDFASSQSLLALGKSLLSAFSNVLTGSIVVLGVAVVVFALLERSGVAPTPDDETWDPTTLPEVDDPDKISLGDLVASIGFLIVALVVVNFFKDAIGAFVTMDDESGWIPFLGPVFDTHLWLLNLCLVLDLAVNFTVLLRGRWSTALRWTNFAINALYFTWLWRLAIGPSIIEVDPALMVENGWTEAAASKFQEMTSGPLARGVAIGLKVGLIAALVGLCVELFKLLRRIVGRF